MNYLRGIYSFFKKCVWHRLKEYEEFFKAISHKKTFTAPVSYTICNSTELILFVLV